MLKVVSILLVVITVLLGLATARTIAGTTWTVRAGASGPNNATQALRFLPKEVTVDEGDTVRWALAGSDHTIYFPAGQKLPDLIVPGKTKGELLWNPIIFFPSPQKTYDGAGPISGGAMLQEDPHNPKSYSLTFTKAGTYKYVCMFHPGMEGTVIVQAAGSPYPKTQAQYDQTAATEAKAALAKAAALLAQTKPVVATNARKRTYTLNLVGLIKDGATFYRFPGQTLTIRRGDTVTWVMQDPTELHTVSFGKPNLDIVTVKPQPQGPPILVVTPQAFAPAGGSVHRGAGFYNSGFLLTEGPGVRRYSLTFTKSGTYQYTCAVHAYFGMKAAIVVK